MTPSPEDVERMIEKLREIPVWMVGAMTPGWQEHGTTAYQAADMLAALSAIGGDE